MFEFENSNKVIWSYFFQLFSDSRMKVLILTALICYVTYSSESSYYQFIVTLSTRLCLFISNVVKFLIKKNNFFLFAYLVQRTSFRLCNPFKLVHNFSNFEVLPDLNETKLSRKNTTKIKWDRIVFLVINTFVNP